MNHVPSQQSLLGRALRAVVGVLVGIVIAFVLVVLVEGFSAVVHPFPEDFAGTPEEVCLHVTRYPQWVLAAVVPLWGLTAYVSTWVGKRIGGWGAASVVGLLLLASVVFNISMLPYPLWFKLASVAVVVAAVLVAAWPKMGKAAGAAP